MLDKWNRILLAVLVLLTAIAIWITLQQEVQAQYCHLEWRSYWSYWYGRRVSYPVWCCGLGYNKRCQVACLNRYGGYGPCW